MLNIKNISIKKLFSSLTISAIVVATIFSAISTFPKILTECWDSRSPIVIVVPMLLVNFANIIMAIMLALSALYLAIYSLIKKRASLPAIKLTLWLLSFFIFYFLFSFMFMKFVDYVRYVAENKIATATKELKLYRDKNNSFPDSLDEAGIEDFIFYDIPTFRINYKPSPRQAALYLLSESTYIELKEEPYVETRAVPPGPLGFTPKCGF